MKAARLHIDPVALALVSAIVLLGLIMVTSASISIASRDGGDSFSFLERQLVLCLVGGVLAAMVFCVRTELLEKMAWPLLIVAVVLLFLVLIPGVGHVVNGSRRWIRLLGFNFQASELARVLVLIFIASYAVRREDELRSTALGLVKPMALLGFVALLLLAEPDFGAASVLLISGFGILFIAGARLRYVLLVAAVCAGALALLVLMAPYRMARVTSFLDPVGGSVQQRLPAHAVADRHRARRVVRRRASARACRSCSICRRRTPTSCSRCWPRSWGWWAWPRRWRCSSAWCGAASGSRSSPRAPACSSRPISPRASASGWAARRSSTSA